MNKASPNWLNFLSISFLALWLLLASVPFLWTFWGSFKVQADFFSKQDWQYAIFGIRTIVETGANFTSDGYKGAWIQEDFWKAALNTAFVTLSVVTISLTLGTLGGYALARSGFFVQCPISPWFLDIYYHSSNLGYGDTCPQQSLF